MKISKKNLKLEKLLKNEISKNCDRLELNVGVLWRHSRVRNRLMDRLVVNGFRCSKWIVNFLPPILNKQINISKKFLSTFSRNILHTLTPKNCQHNIL